MSTVGERLRAKRKQAGLSAAELGARAAMVLGRSSLSAAAVRHHENGTTGFSKDVAEAYAKVLKTTASWILFGEEEVVPVTGAVRQVPILGQVQAGAWTAVPLEEEARDYVSVALPQFARAQLYALRVVGRSMDREYPEGTIVVVCPAAEIGIKDGDHVIVRRRKGAEYETTVKEIVQEEAGVALWPRSTDPAYQSPIRVRADREADDGVEIIGVVVASYKLRGARPGPLIRL